MPGWLRLAALAAALLPAPVMFAAPDVVQVVLDPGHSPARGGAIGVRGLAEVVYNDRFSARLAAALRAAGFRLVLTRQPEQELALGERARLANQHAQAIFLSIHHDSAQEHLLQAQPASAGGGWRTRQPMSGHSLFVSRRNVRFDDSLALARLLGSELHQLGRAPTLHHAEDIDGERRELLDRQLGIYRYDELAVLAHTQIPAVLLEIGLIVDTADEAWLSRPANQDAVCAAIVRALLRWQKQQQAHTAAAAAAP